VYSSLFSFVCATPGKTPQIGNPFLLRTYEHRGAPNRAEASTDTLSTVKIWEALRATSAAPSFFDPIRIGTEDYVDGGLGCNNPAVQVYEESRTYWKNEDKFPEIGCLVSLGTGMPKVLPEADEPSYSGVYGVAGLWNSLVSKLTPVDKQVAEVYMRIATQCEKTHREMLRKNELKGKYFRFNVQQGLQNISLEEYGRLGEVRVHTDA
jgi:patatin-like phospholipase/acyl hydrolase